MGVIIIIRGCVERCCSNNKIPPYGHHQQVVRRAQVQTRGERTNRYLEECLSPRCCTTKPRNPSRDEYRLSPFSSPDLGRTSPTGRHSQTGKEKCLVQTRNRGPASPFMCVARLHGLCPRVNGRHTYHRSNAFVLKGVNSASASIEKQ